VKHELIAGITRSGKSFFSFHEIQHSDRPTIYINVKGEKLKGVEPIKTMDKKNTVKQLLHALKHYKAVDFRVSDNKRDQKIEMIALCGTAMKRGGVDLVVDEAWTFIPQGTHDSPLFTVARRGLSEGVRLKIITQTPADVDKKLIKQCEIIRVFRLNNWDYKYLDRVGLPADQIRDTLKASEKYSHVKMTDGEVVKVDPVKSN